MKNIYKYGMPVITLLLVLGIWEGCVYFFDIDLYILPAPSKIVLSLIENRDVLWMHSLVTLKEAVAGLIIALFLAILIAIAMDLSQAFKHSIFPHLVVTQTVPVFMCFFPIVISFCDALGNVDQKQINLLRSFGAKKWQVYAYVKIPAASTALFSGLKVAATYCIGGAIVGEWLSASAGLGYYMIRVKNGYMLDKVFACVVVVILLSLALHGIVSIMEKIIFPHTRKRRG